MSTKVAELVRGKEPLSALEVVAERALLEVKAVRQGTGRTRGLPQKGDEAIRHCGRFLAELGAEMVRQACCLMAEHESGHREGAKKGRETRRKNMDALST